MSDFLHDAMGELERRFRDFRRRLTRLEEAAGIPTPACGLPAAPMDLISSSGFAAEMAVMDYRLAVLSEYDDGRLTHRSV